MANPIETMTPGQILTDTSVSNFIQAMGISIANAQLQLDLNSLSQVGEYVMPREGLGGKSLLQLGLSPPFYHYQHADLTVRLQLAMKVGNTESFGIGGHVDFGLNNGPGAGAGTGSRLAQVTLTAVPASVTVAGTRLDVTGTDLEAAANNLAERLRMPTGRFDRVFVNNTARSVTLALVPATARNPVLTGNAIAFLPTSAVSAGLIRIVNTPTAGSNEVYTLASGKVATVNSEADALAFARSVRTAIQGLGGFNARLVRDSAGSTTAPDALGAIAICLFDTGSSVLKPDGLAELGVIATLLRGGTQPVIVSGFTDRAGTEASNRRLGDDRAARVRDQLIALGVAAGRITTPASTGELRWTGDPGPEANAQFRRAEVTLAGGGNYIVVEANGTNLQATPTPDMTGGGTGNGFVAVARSTAQAVDGTAVNVGTAATAVATSGTAVNSDGNVFGTNSPEAFAFNMAAAINAGSATNLSRATRRGSVVFVARSDDAIVLDLLTLGTADISLAADGGARISQPLAAAAAPGGAPATPTADPNRANYALAVGIAVDYRTSRTFEQSVNGNSEIVARLVAVPAPVEFLDEIRTYLAPQPATPTPPPSLTPTPTPPSP
ncbi:OmpA family protein [uncultured Brevundimonas sp.]|uniref:OmpA family protein n=1 Tax=uncultured Brevundimonas sp. TaxID=213418 RepID=UPI0030EEDE83|tara:strand:- start:1873 stop:3702 length:1830 start_codon:yes stop_codon:yes gene_type:complete